MADQSNKKTAKPKPKSNKRFWFGGGAVALAIFLWWGFSPVTGTLLFGICKTFVEMSEPYPQNIEYMGVEELGNIVRMTYKTIDPFGIESFKYLECRFKDDERLGVALEAVDINREKKYPQEDPAYIKKFNEGIPGIIQNPPDLAYPPALPDDIRDYK